MSVNEAATVAPVITVTPVVPGGQKTEAPAKPIETKPDPQSQDSFSKRFSALNRERKEIDRKNDQVKREAAKMEAEKAEIAKAKAEIAEFNEKKAKIKEEKNPIKALMEFGYSYEDAANFVLNDQKPTADLMVKSVEEKVAKLEAELAQTRKEKLENEQKLLSQQEQESNAQAVTAIKEHLAANPEYDALVALGMEENIFQELNAIHAKGEDLPPIEEVADKLLANVKKAMDALTNTQFYKKNYAPASKEPAKSSPKTLSSQLYSQTPAPDRNAVKTDAERFKNALALLNK